MLYTISIGTCILVQGMFVKKHPDGKAVVRVGDRLYEGTPVSGKS